MAIKGWFISFVLNRRFVVGSVWALASLHTVYFLCVSEDSKMHKFVVSLLLIAVLKLSFTSC